MLQSVFSGRWSRARVLVCASLALAVAIPVAAEASPSAASPAGPRAEVTHAVKADHSPPLRSLHPLPPHRGPGPFEVRHRANPALGGGSPLLADPVQQLAAPAAAAPATLTSWDGVSNRDAVVPPDTNGDVGPNDYVQWVNLSFQIWDKSGHSLYGPAEGNTLWQGFGGVCDTTNQGDPVVLYDRMANRWIFSQFAFATDRRGNPVAPYYQCIAISQTGDPTGSYYRYAFRMNASTDDFPDYPKLGVWPDGYYMTTNNFNGNWFDGAGAYAFDRTKMLAGDSSATMLSFTLPSQYEGLLPSTLTGPTAPPAGAPNYFGAVDTSSSTGTGSTFQIWKFHADFSTPANSTFTGPVNVAVAPYTFSFCGQTYATACISQPGTNQTLDPLADRLMNRLEYRNFGDHETLVASHTVNVGSDRAGMRWYELRSPGSAPSVQQQGTFAPADSVSRWMGSVAMNGAGDMALGYSASGASAYPSVRYTGRLSGDPAGTMTVPETTLASGSGSQTGYDRWGDYSSMSVDPADDSTFWYTQEYYSASSSEGWRTRIGSFTLSAADTTPPDTIIDSGPSGPTKSASPTFSFHSTESGSTFQCKLDGPGATTGSYASCSSPKPYSGLVDGAYTFSVRATDAASNTDPTPATRSFTVDTVAPAAPVITSPADGSFNTTGNVALSGTAEANSSVEVFDGATSKGTTTANGAGNWSKSLSAVPNGSHSYTAKATDAAGNTSEASGTVTVTVDTTAPAVTLTSPAAGTSTNDSTPTFSGGAGTAPGDSSTVTVKVYAGSTATGTPVESRATTASGSAWSVDASPALDDGTYTAQAEQADSAGNTGKSAVHTFTIDTVAPDAPVITTPADGSTNTTGDLTLAGIAEANSTVELFDDGASKGATTADGSGKWSKSLTALANGSHTYTAKARDAAGNTSAASNATTITVDVAAPPPQPPTLATSPPPPAPRFPPPLVDTTPPGLTLKFNRTQKLRTVLRRGIAGRARCSEMCSVRFTVLLTRSTAKRLHIAARYVTIGRLTKRLIPNTTSTIRVKLTRKARRRLAHVRRIKVRLTVRGTDAAGNASRTVVRSITLKR